jgi:hypothetical protein
VAAPVELAGDVVTGATALAGLFLVYLGNTAAAFSSFETPDQSRVKGVYQARGWLAFAGIASAIVAAILAVAGKWAHSNSFAGAGIILLLVALLVGASVAAIAVLDIR